MKRSGIGRPGAAGDGAEAEPLPKVPWVLEGTACHPCHSSLPDSLRPMPTFLIYHIGSKTALPHTFASPSVTSGNHYPAPLCTLWHIPEFLMCHIRSKYGLPRGFPSPSVTSGNHYPAPLCTLWHIPEFLMCHIRSKYGLQRGFPSPSVTSGENDSINQRGRLC